MVNDILQEENVREEEQKKKTEQAENMLKDILPVIEITPKEERWSLFQQQKEYEYWYIELAKLLFGKNSLKIFNCRIDTTENDSLASDRFNVYTLALIQAIEEYQYKEETPFLRKLKKKYKQLAGLEGKGSCLREELMGMGLSRRKNLKINAKKSAKNKSEFETVKKTINLFGRYRNYKQEQKQKNQSNKVIHENFKKLCIEEGYSESLIKQVIEMEDYLPYFRYELFSEEEGKVDVSEYVTDIVGSEGYKTPEAFLVEEENKKEAEKYLDFLIKAFEIQEASCKGEKGKVRKMQFFRAFFTCSILKCLKLEHVEDEDDTRKEERCKGCYRFIAYPAGDKEIYDILKKQEKFYMNQGFQMDYIKRAVESEPEKLDILYGIYYNFLREKFKFTDKEIGETLKEDSRRVSYYRTRYDDFLDKIYQVIKENGWE